LEGIEAMKQLLAVVALIATAGCTQSTGVLPLGNGEFTIVVENDWSTGGLAGAQRMGVEQATQHCASLGQQFQAGPVNMTPQVYGGYATFSMRFRCTP
jgi:hypothetical protein